MAWGLEAHERIRTSQPGDLVMGWEHQIYIVSQSYFHFSFPMLNTFNISLRHCSVQ